MGQGRFGHDRILSGVIVCHVVGNNGVFPERGSRGPCVGFWVPGSIWQRMWYFCAKFLWIKGVFYHGLCVIIYAGRIVTCLHWYLIRVIGRMTSLEWFSIWETSNNIINFNDVRKRLWKLVSMMMFSPCVFCVLPCVTSTFTVSKLARIIKQASRVGGCERVFTPLFPNPPTPLTCHSTGKPGEPCRPAPPPAVPSTRGSSTSTSHRGRSDAHKLPTPGRPAGLTSQPNGHTTWW